MLTLMRELRIPRPAHYGAMLLGVQLFKLALILSQPDNSVFLNWFYGVETHAPYTYYFYNGSAAYLAGPYSLVWYLLNIPARWGFFAWNFYALAIDCAFCLVIWRWHDPLYGFLWVQMSVYFLLVSPQDYFIYLLIFLGRERAAFLPLAALVKAPLLPPILDSRIWLFIFTSDYSTRSGENWARYAMLAVAFGVSAMPHAQKWTCGLRKLLIRPVLYMRVRIRKWHHRWDASSRF